MLATGAFGQASAQDGSGDTPGTVSASGGPGPSGPSTNNLTVTSTFTGRGGFSADGLGQDGTGDLIQADVPGGSTVEQAFLYGSYFSGTDPTLEQRTIDFDGTVSVLTKIGDNAVGGLSAARADVTAQVAAKVGGGGGITDFAVNSDPFGLDGVGLVVVFSNPGLPESTIAVMDGAQQSAGDNFAFNFLSPLGQDSSWVRRYHVPGHRIRLSGY